MEFYALSVNFVGENFLRKAFLCFFFFLSSVFAFLSSVPLALGLLTSQLRSYVAFVGLVGS